MKYVWLVALLPGCAAMQAVGGFFTGAAKGAGDALPDAIDDLSSGNWIKALMTLGGAAIAGGGAWFWRRKRKKNAAGLVPMG